MGIKNNFTHNYSEKKLKFFHILSFFFPHYISFVSLLKWALENLISYTLNLFYRISFESVANPFSKKVFEAN
jgi:hypothetical protein